MRVGSGLLAQLERCGLSAKLADEHAEIGEDMSGSRVIRYEIGRAYAANDQATVPEANVALLWLTHEPGRILTVGEPVDLIDQETGEVLVTGKPGAIVANPDGQGLVVSWRVGDQYDAPEPEDDLGLIAMGLAKLGGQPFRTAYVTLESSTAFPRKSPVFEPAQHPALLARVKNAASRPRIACPGDWCGACRQNVHCEAWLSRSKLALEVFDKETAVTDNEGALVLELTDDNCGAFSQRISTLEKVLKFAKEARNTFVRHGGRCVVNGKQLVLTMRDGQKRGDVNALEAAGLKQYIKQGDPYEFPVWKKVRQ
jgi:hypothetical protein